MKHQPKIYLKTLILLFGISLLLWNCEKENFSEPIQQIEKESPFKVKTVTLSEIPQIKSFIQDKINPTVFTKSTEIDGAIFDQDNILEVIDTLNHINYSFRFSYPDTPVGTFYNLIVGETPQGENKTPYVLKYVCDDASLEAFVASNFNFESFKGSIAIHKYTDFFQVGSFTKSDPNCPPNNDENGDPIPCDTAGVDGGSTGSSGGGGNGESGDGPSNNGGSSSGGETNGGSGSSSCSWHLEYSCWCNGDLVGAHDHSPVVLVIVCPPDNVAPPQDNNTVTKSANDDCPDCPDGTEGGVGVNTDNNDDDISTEEFIEEQIIDTNLDPCSKGILKKLKKLQTNDIANVLKRFGSPTSVYDWEIKTGTPTNPDNIAETNWKDDSSGNAISNSYVTILKPSYTNTATDLAIARTILHEAIHAYILSYIDNLISDTSTRNDFQTDFLNVWNYFVAKTNDVAIGNIEDAHHQEMAENFITVISEALGEYDNNQQDSLYYDQLAWGALMNTDAFSSALGSNGYMDQSEQEAILIANQQEDTNGTNAKGSPCP